MKVYLAGAIHGVEDPITWRQDVTYLLPTGWEAVDPMQIELFVENEDADENARKVVEVDLAAIRECDAVLVSIGIPSWGTAMEVFYAHSLGIPVIGWNPEEKPFGPWLKVHCKYIFSDFYNIKLVLQNLLVKA